MLINGQRQHDRPIAILAIKMGGSVDWVNYPTSRRGARISGLWTFFRQDRIAGIGSLYRFHDERVHIQIGLRDDRTVRLFEHR